MKIYLIVLIYLFQDIIFSMYKLNKFHPQDVFYNSYKCLNTLYKCILLYEFNYIFNHAFSDLFFLRINIINYEENSSLYY